jgi:hypothetical protein
VSRNARQALVFRSALPQKHLPLNQERQHPDLTTVTVYTFLHRRKFALGLRHLQQLHPLCASTPFYHSTACPSLRVCASSPTPVNPYSVITASLHHIILPLTRAETSTMSDNEILGQIANIVRSRTIDEFIRANEVMAFGEECVDSHGTLLWDRCGLTCV